MSKLVSMGDCIIDFLPSAPGEMTYSAKMGGAPVNVCAAVAKLGGRACFFGKLAEDMFGRYLLGEMDALGVDTSLVVRDGRCKTGLAFVDLHPDGDRDFFFYRDLPADASLSPEEVDEDIFKEGDVLHFCSISLPPSQTRDAIKKAAACARERGATVSFDVNVRLNLWKSAEDLKAAIDEFLPFADIVKVTDEELDFITGLSDEKEAVKLLFGKSDNAKIVFVTKGEKGSSVYDRALGSADIPACPAVVADTTGAGDTFIGALAAGRVRGLSLAESMHWGAQAAALAVSRLGAQPSIPTAEEVGAFQ